VDAPLNREENGAIVRGIVMIGSLALALHGCGSGSTEPDGASADSRASEPETAAEGDARSAEDRPVPADQSLPDGGPAAAPVDAPVDSAPEAGIEAGADVRADVGSAAAGCCCRPGNICAAFCAEPTKPCCVVMIHIECLSNGGVYQSSCSVGGTCQ